MVPPSEPYREWHCVDPISQVAPEVPSKFFDLTNNTAPKCILPGTYAITISVLINRPGGPDTSDVLRVLLEMQNQVGGAYNFSCGNLEIIHATGTPDRPQLTYTDVWHLPLNSTCGYLIINNSAVTYGFLAFLYVQQLWQG
jgi:hypothetical protein